MKAFLIKTSIGQDIQIDQDELEKAKNIWRTGEIGQFKQGLIRGDLIGVIVEDKERVVVEQIFDPKLGRNVDGKPQLLKNIFNQTKLLE